MQGWGICPGVFPVLLASQYSLILSLCILVFSKYTIVGALKIASVLHNQSHNSGYAIMYLSGETTLWVGSERMSCFSVAAWYQIAERVKKKEGQN